MPLFFYIMTATIDAMIAILYNIRSIQNVGAIFRTADAAGITKLYLCGITPTPLDRFGKKRSDLTKASLGAEDSVAWEKIGATTHPAATLSLIKRLKKEGCAVLSLEQSPSSIPYTTYRKKSSAPIALIVGNEVTGIPKSILNLSDAILEIPMRGKKESLNVSVSFGIAAYELIK